MKIAFLSHSPDTGTFKVGSHHFAREFAQAGHQVVHVSTAISILHALKLRDAGIRYRFRLALGGGRLDRSGVLHLVPLSLLPTGSRLTNWLGKRYVNRIKSRMNQHLGGAPDVAIVDQVKLWDGLRTLNPARKIYRPTDVHFDEFTVGLEQQFLAEADALVATSPVVLEHMRQLAGRSIPTLLVENGVDVPHFRTAARVPWSERSGFVYVGALDARFDWEAVVKLAASLPDHPVRVVGPAPDSIPVSLPSNVDMIGPVAYDRVPEELGKCQVGILPMSSHPGNAGRSPMKFYEYLAAGLWVIATSSPALESRDLAGALLVSQDGSWDAAAQESIARAAAGPNTTGAAVAESFSWTGRAELLESFLELEVPVPNV